MGAIIMWHTSIGNRWVRALLWAPLVAWAGVARPQGGVVDDALKSVVLIRCTDKDGGRSSGTGFLVDTHDVVATNYHVIEGATTVQIEYSDKSIAVIDGFLAIAPQYDLAVLHVGNPLENRRPLSLRDAPPALADRVFALGSPLGLAQSVTAGVVSQRKTFLEIATELEKTGGAPKTDYSPDSIWIQTNTPISSGNSGGPLIDERGSVVGLNTWALRDDGAQNINFAIDVSHLRTLLKRQSPKPQEFASLPPPRNVMAGGGVKGEVGKTLECWDAAREIIASVTLDRDEANLMERAERTRLPRIQETARRNRDDLRLVAEKLDVLPRVDVDAEVVIFVRKLQESFRHLHNSQVALDNVFFGPAYPGQVQDFWKWVEVRNFHMLNTYNLLHTTAPRLRDALTFGYGKEFPRFCDSEELAERREDIAKKTAELAVERKAEKRWGDYQRLKSPDAQKSVLKRIIEAFPDTKTADKARAELKKRFGE